MILSRKGARFDLSFLKRFKQPHLPRFWSAFLLLGAVLVLSSCSSVVPAEGWAGMTVDKDGRFAYVTNKEAVFKIDLQNVPSGMSTVQRYMVWKTALPSNTHTYTLPAFSADGSTLYVGAFDKKPYALDANTGVIQAGFNPPQADDKIFGSALVVNDLVYIGMGDKGLRVYDAKNGNEKLRFTDPKYGVWATPILDSDGDTLYIASLDHFIYATSIKNNLSVLWKVDTGGAIGGTPLIYKGIMYTGTFAGQVVAISLADHKIIGTFSTVNNGWVWGTPVLYKHGEAAAAILFGDLEGYVYSIDPAQITDGQFKLNWKANDPDRPGGVRGSVLVAQDVNLKDASNPDLRDIVMAGSESKYLRAYDAKTGALIWTAGIGTEDRIVGDLHVIKNGDRQNVIFTTLSDNEIVKAYDVQTGQPAWAVNIGDATNYLATVTLTPPVHSNTPEPTAAIAPATAAPSTESATQDATQPISAPTSAATSGR
jgi:outer membrane protein assembly factor BamB